MNEMTNLKSIQGLEALEVDKDGCVTLNQDQIALVENALGQKSQQEQELRSQVETADNIISQLNDDISAKAEEITRLQTALEEGKDGGAEETAQAQAGEASEPMNASDICREHLKKFHNN